MIKIRLFCAAGMSTSLLVNKMKEAAKAMNIEADIAAAGETKMHDETDGIDVVSAGTGEMDKRYGFIYVDKHNDRTGTLARSKKKSFDWYKKVIATNGEDLS